MLIMTSLHWIVVAIFVLLFVILVLLSLKEDDKKNLFSMIFSSFLLVAVGIVFSLYALDKYTKKAKLISVEHKRDFNSESVKIRGKIKNIGNFKIGYCNLEVKISNEIKRGGKRKSYFTPNRSLSGIFDSKKVEGNIFKEEYLIVKDLESKKSKNFTIKVPFPPRFDNPKYRYKLYCH